MQVKEEFLGFKEAPGRTTGEVIANLMLEALDDCKVDTTSGKLRGQDYQVSVRAYKRECVKCIQMLLMSIASRMH